MKRKRLDYKAAHRALDDARDAFIRAAAALASFDRLRPTSLATALVEAGFGLSKLKEADADKQGYDEALQFLREKQGKPP